MLKRCRFLGLAVVCALISGGGCNIYSEFSDKNSDAAKIDDARIYIDQSKWTEAINKLLTVSSARLAHRDVRSLLASAYAGRCGLNVISLLNNLANPGASTFFQVLYAAFKYTTTSQYSDCVSAETLLTTIGAASARTGDENILMVLVAFAKMGTIMSVQADLDVDGVVDGTFDNCQSTSPPGITDAYATQGVTAIGNMMLSLAQIGTTISGAPTANIQQVCNTLAGIDPTYDICSVTDAAAVTANQRNAFRTLVGTQNPVTIGLINGPKQPGLGQTCP